MTDKARKATVHITATGGHYVDLREVVRSDAGKGQISRVARIRVGGDAAPANDASASRKTGTARGTG